MLVREGMYPNNGAAVGFISGTTLELVLKSDTDNNTIYTKPLGVKLSNIYVPDELKDIVQGWALSYNKRDANNATIISQSVMFDQTNIRGDISSGAFRFHGFDIMQGETLLLHPSFVKLQAIINHSTTVYSTDANK